MAEFKLPELGENIEGGDVVNVLVSVGDTIKADQEVLELETDKATIMVPSSVGGKITEIHISEGDYVEVGQVVLTLERAAGENGKSGAPPESEEEASAEKETQEEKTEKKEADEAPTQEAEDAPESTDRGPVEFKLPELGENIEGGEVVNVLVSVGDTVKADQEVLELETDKATITVPSSVSGTVEEIQVSEGDHVEVGQVVFTVSGAKAKPSEKEASSKKKAAEEKAPKKETKEKEKPPAETKPVSAADAVPQAIDVSKAAEPIPEEIQPNEARSAVPAAPYVRRLAREFGIDIAQVPPGETGRVTADDLKAFARQRHQGQTAASAKKADQPVAPAPAAASKPLPDFSKWGQIETEKMSGIRRATANQMAYAWTSAPRVTQFDKADIEELEAMRQKYGPRLEKSGGKLTITAILLKVVSAALKQFPKFNAAVDVPNEQIIFKKYYHIGVAVDTPQGLLVPVIRDVDRKNIFELAVELSEVAAKARDRKLGLEDMQGGCFTISNLGGIGGTNFAPIVNAPEVAILGVSRSQVEPVFDGEAFQPRLMMPLSLSYDHRLIDGADGARFLRWICEALEDPLMMSLQAW